MEELTDLINSTQVDKYVLGLLNTEEDPAFRRLITLYPELRHEIMLAELFLTETSGKLPPPEILRQRRLELGQRLLPASHNKANSSFQGNQATIAEKNAEILLQHLSPLYITEHKYLKIAFWALVGLLVVLLFITIGFYITVNFAL
jgi:hypothetical protein